MAKPFVNQDFGDTIREANKQHDKQSHKREKRMKIELLWAFVQPDLFLLTSRTPAFPAEFGTDVSGSVECCDFPCALLSLYLGSFLFLSQANRFLHEISRGIEYGPHQSG